MNYLLNEIEPSVQHETAQYSYHTRFDRDGRVLSSHHDEKCELVTGYTPTDYLDNPNLWIDMVHPKDKIAVGHFFDRLRINKSSGHIEHRVIRKDGVERWVSNFCVISLEDETVFRGDGFVIDITDRKIGEEDRLRLASLVQSAEDAILSETLDGIITSWNMGAERIYGYTSEEVIGKSISILTTDDYKAEPFEILDKIAKDERVSVYQTVRRSKCGDHIHVSLTVSPIKTSSGDIIGASLIARDITEIKHVEKALRQSEEKLEAILLSSPDIILVLNGSSIVEELFTAQDHLLWASRENILSLPISSHLEDDVSNRIMDGIEKAKASSRPIPIEFSMRIANEPRDFSALASKLLSDNLMENRVILIIRDQTESKRVERLREDVERIVKHDLKTPLSSITGYSQLLMDENDPDRIKHMAELIFKSSYDMLHMIDHSLDLFKMEEGTYLLMPESVNLVDLFQKLFNSFLMLRTSNNLLFQSFINGEKLKSGDSYCVPGEKILLENLFGNLIKNAIEASPANSSISIAMERKEDHHFISIHNEGVIPDHVQKRFFDRYITTKKNGTGLGTYSSYLITKTHGGEISFNSSLEHGTSLYVKLPLVRDMKLPCP